METPILITTPPPRPIWLTILTWPLALFSALTGKKIGMGGEIIVLVGWVLLAFLVAVITAALIFRRK